MGSNHQSTELRQIFILSGQSNMAGRGGVNHKKHFDNIIPPECLPNPSIHRLSAKLHWELAHEPLHADIDTKKACGVGPGMAFANSVLGRVGRVDLVPCAVGGTAIKEWKKGESLYENMIKRAQFGGVDGEIRAVLWYQGESDCVEHDVDLYKVNLENFIRDLRSDLQLPNLPIIQVAIASGDKKYLEKIREAQKAIDIPNVVCVDAKGLELKDDHLHLTTAAQVTLGHMLAEAYLTNFHAEP